MPGPRKRLLLTGPPSSGLLDRAIARASTLEGPSLWLAPSPLARDQIKRRLARRPAPVDSSVVWCWEDVWQAVSLAHPSPPARLGSTALRTVLIEAIDRARRADSLDVLNQCVDFPGYRRLLGERFSTWTREERPVDGPAPGDSTVETEEWAVFGHYRATLRELEAEDLDGWAVWASRELERRPQDVLRTTAHLFVIEPLSSTRSTRRLLDLCQRLAKSITVTLPFDPSPELVELYASVEPIRRQFLDSGYVEEPADSGTLGLRSHGFEAIERELFRVDAHSRPKLSLGDFRVLGGPRGEGLGLLIAREVRDEIQNGCHPEDILILVPRLDEDAEAIRQTLRSWGLPVGDRPGPRLSTMPAVSALRLAMRLPGEGWEASTLIRLLRNGQVRWDLPAQVINVDPFEAAAAVRASRVFRGFPTIRDALERAIDGETARKDARHARSARLILDHLGALLDPIARPGPWALQVERLQRLAGGLGIAQPPLESLWDALDDQGWVLQRLGPAISESAWTWSEFVVEVEAIITSAPAPLVMSAGGSIRLELVGDVDAARAAVVILANLTEKTFPTPDAVELDLNPQVGRVNLPYAREMLRFVRAVGSAERRLVLAFPTTDRNGEPLLPAGFLDDILRRLDDTTRAKSVEVYNRFDPVLSDQPTLAGSPTDARVLAVALACLEGKDEPLRKLATNLDQASALIGTAQAFEVAHLRRVNRAFGPFDGRLGDVGAIAKIRQEFGTDHAFSASQLESFALCPFQFFQRYVLGLKPVDVIEELDEDYAGRGQNIHQVLEDVHQIIAQQGAENLLDRLIVLIQTRMTVELERHDDPGPVADVAQVLREIETRRNGKILDRYVAQFRDYDQKVGKGAEPHKFEVLFGQPDRGEASLDHLSFGEDTATVRFQGMIDRIDLVFEDGKFRFRVIDYKTGSNPSAADVRAGLASQLPLYALAAEKLVFPEQEHATFDAGYWSLPKNGFKNVKIGDWPTYRDRLMTFVLELVAELRGGAFPIDSQKKDCQKYCDFQTTCRVREVRSVGKLWDGRPTLEEDA